MLHAFRFHLAFRGRPSAPRFIPKPSASGYQASGVALLIVAFALLGPATAQAQEFLLIPASPEDDAPIEAIQLDAPVHYTVERVGDQDGDGVGDYLLTALADSASVASGNVPQFTVSGERSEYPRIASPATTSEGAGSVSASFRSARAAKTGGTPATGTLTSLTAGAAGGDYLVELGGSIYFRGYTPETGTELFRYDPSGSGPVLAADILPGSDSSSPSNITRVGSQLYFVAYTPATGYELFRYDPATDRPSIVAETVDGPGSTSIGSMVEVDGDLLFSGYDSVRGYEPWRYDSATGQVTPLSDLNPGTYTYTYSYRYRCGFSYCTRWVTNTSPNNSYPSGFRQFGDDVYFSATTSGSGRELWRYEPSTGSLMLSADILPGEGGSGPEHLEVLGDYLYFSAITAEAGRELVRFSPSSGVTLVSDIQPGPESVHIEGSTYYYGKGSSSPSYLTAYDGQLYFGARLYFSIDSGEGHRLMRYDPTSGDVSDLATTVVGGQKLTPLDGSLYYSGYTPGAGYELWSFGVSSTQAEQVADIFVGAGSSNLNYLTALDGSLYFSAYGTNPSGNSEYGLWRYTPALSTPVAVTFSVDMTFNPLAPGQIAGLRGSVEPLGWESTTVLSDDDGDGVYTGTVAFDATTAGQTLEYKFVRHDAGIDPPSTGDGIEFEGDVGIDVNGDSYANRLLTLPAASTVLPVVFWNNLVLCSTEAPFAVGAFDPAAGTVTLTNGSATEEADLADCTLAVFDPLEETVIDAVTSAARVEAGGTATLEATLTAGPGAFALVEGTIASDAGVLDVLGRVVAAVVYGADGSVYGACGNGAGVAPCASPEAQATLAAALAAAFGGSVASEADGAVDLAVGVWPNPSTGATRVAFGLAEAGVARVAVYDALGREVAVVAEGPFPAGRHEAALDARALPAGVYVVRSVTPGGSQTARLTVAR